jgi:hypothetical protein
MIVPLPDPGTDTGGTSWFPVSVTFTPCSDDIPAQPASKIAAAPAPARIDRAVTCHSRIIRRPPRRLPVRNNNTGGGALWHWLYNSFAAQLFPDPLRS